MSDDPGDTNWIPFNGGVADEVNIADAGDPIVRAYCIHNLGTTTVNNAAFKIYLSDDDTIDTGDVVLGTFTPTLTANGEPYCPARTVTIPSETDPDVYWIGAIIDPTNYISEMTEDNNTVRDSGHFVVQ